MDPLQSSSNNIDGKSQETIIPILNTQFHGINIEITNKELSHQTITKLKDIRHISSNINDYINRVTSAVLPANIYRGIEVNRSDDNTIDVTLIKKNYFHMFIHQDITGSLTLNNIFKDFDTVEAQVGIKPQLNKPYGNFNYFRTGFLYSLPFNNIDSGITLTGFNRNKLLIQRNSITSQNSLKGVQLGYNNRYLALYTKEVFSKQADASPLKIVLRYKDKRLFGFFNADLKSSIDPNVKLDYLARVSKTLLLPISIMKNCLIMSNDINAVYSSRKLNLLTDKHCYYFDDKSISSGMYINNLFRLSKSYNTSNVVYSIFGFANCLVYRGSGDFRIKNNLGVGAKAQIMNDIAVEGFLNIYRRESEKLALCRIIYDN